METLLLNLKNILEVTQSRGVWRMNEVKDIAGVYDSLLEEINKIKKSSDTTSDVVSISENTEQENSTDTNVV